MCVPLPIHSRLQHDRLLSGVLAIGIFARCQDVEEGSRERGEMGEQAAPPLHHRGPFLTTIRIIVFKHIKDDLIHPLVLQPFSFNLKR